MGRTARANRLTSFPALVSVGSPNTRPIRKPETKKRDVVWFDLNEDRPLFAFAGMWTTYNGEGSTKSKPIAGPHGLWLSDDIT